MNTTWFQPGFSTPKFKSKSTATFHFAFFFPHICSHLPHPLECLSYSPLHTLTCLLESFRVQLVFSLSHKGSLTTSYGPSLLWSLTAAIMQITRDQNCTLQLFHLCRPELLKTAIKLYYFVHSIMCPYIYYSFNKYCPLCTKCPANVWINTILSH